MRRKFRRGTSFILSTLLTVMMVFGNFTMPVTAEGTGESKEPEIASENTSENTTEVTPEDTSEKSSETPSEDSSEETSEEQVPLLRGAYSNNNSLGGSGTEEDPYLIEDEDDWNTFASNVNEGTGTDAYYKLSDSFTGTITTTVGTQSNPFAGHFDGNNKTLDVNIAPSADEESQGTAPFRYISGATIHDIIVTGTVDATAANNDKAYHAAGLVGFNWSGESTISNCKVSVIVIGRGYAGGIVGHGKAAMLNLERCIFDGSITVSNAGSSTDQRVGGLLGWSDSSTLTATDCLFKGSYSASLDFHPIACKAGGDVTITYTIDRVYSTVDQNRPSTDYYIANNVAGFVYTEEPEHLYRKIKAVDNVDYYVPYTISGIQGKYFLNATPEYTVKDSFGNPATGGTDFTVSVTRGGQAVTALDQTGDYKIAFTGNGSTVYGSETLEFEVIPTITYQDFVLNEETQKYEFVTKDVPSDCKIIDSSMTTWTSGWYVLTENVTFQDGAKNIRIDLAANADVKLVLCNGNKMTVTNGIKVGSGSKLTIYGQEGNTGRLESSGYEARMAGIGGYYTGSTSSSACGDITINGGTIIANGSTKAAGIGGGGTDGVPAPNGTITINGGNVTAKGSTIVNDNAAGIGGGNYQVGGNIIIRGGVIDATSRNGGYGIGKGSGNVNDDNTTITLDPYNMNSLQVKSNSYGGKVVLKTNFKDKNGTDVFKSSENFQNKNLLANKTIVPCDLDVYTYTIDLNNGNSKTSTDYETGTGITLQTPQAISENWDFLGWQLNDDTDLKAAGYQFELNEDVTAKAIWKCSVTISDTIEHGSVTCETTQAKVGDTITLTVVPDANLRYFAKSVTASYTENGSGTINATADESDATVYTFTMPNAPVTVSASFEVDKDDLNAGWAHKRPILTWDESSVADYYTVQIDEEAEINVGSATTYDVTDYIVEHGAWSKSHSYSIKGYTNDDILVAESNIDKCRFHIIDVQIHTSGGDGSETGGSLFFETDGDVQKVDATGTKLYYLSDEAEPTELSVSYECNKGFYETDGKIYVHENKIYPITYLLENGGSFPAYSSSESTFIVEVYFNKDSSTKGVQLYFGESYTGESELALQEIHEKYDENAGITAANILHYNTLKQQTVGDLLDEVNRILTDAGVEAHNGNSFRVGLKESYSSYQEYYADIEENRDKKLNEYTPDDTAYDEYDEEITVPVPVSLYIQWLPIVDEINITADKALCGTTETPNITIDSANTSKVTSENQLWADADSRSPITAPITGGDSVLLMFDLYPTFNYAVTNSTVVNVNGEKATVSAKDGGGILVEKEYVAEHVFDANNVCTVCGEKALPKFEGHSVLLSGQIGLVFWLDLPMASYYEYEGVEFNIPGRNGGKRTVSLSEANYDADKALYGFTCKLSTLQMAQQVTTVLHYTDNGEEKTLENTHSVEDYIYDFVDEASKDPDRYDETTLNLVKALNDYGYYVQDFLASYHEISYGQNTYNRIKEAYAEAYDRDAYKNIAEQYAASRSYSRDIENITFSVNFDSDTSIYVYLKMVEGAGTPTVILDGQSYTPVKRPDGRYRVEINNIKAQEFGNPHFVSAFTKNGFGAQLQASVLSYMDLAYSSDNVVLKNIRAKHAVISMYKFYEAADAYVNAHL